MQLEVKAADATTEKAEAEIRRAKAEADKAEVEARKAKAQADKVESELRKLKAEAEKADVVAHDANTVVGVTGVKSSPAGVIPWLLLGVGFFAFGFVVGGVVGGSATSLSQTLVTGLFSFVGGVLLSFAGFYRYVKGGDPNRLVLEPAKLGVALIGFSVGMGGGLGIGNERHRQYQCEEKLWERSKQREDKFWSQVVWCRDHWQDKGTWCTEENLKELASQAKKYEVEVFTGKKCEVREAN